MNRTVVEEASRLSPVEMEENTRDLDRIIFFSDAVIAIAITILVLDFRIPENLTHQQVPAHLRHLWPQFLSYALSFLVIGLYWLSHHRMFRFVRRHDTTLLLLNLSFLLLVAFIPFPTRLLVLYGDSLIVTIFYPAVLIVTGLLLLLTWLYATKDRRLVDRDLDENTIRAVAIQSSGYVVVFAVSMVAALISIRLAEIIWLLSAVTAVWLQLRPLGLTQSGVPEE